MAASITANPNPVLISVWSFTQKKTTTITWDTDSAAFGRVYRSIDGAKEEFFDGTPESPPPVSPAMNKRNGSKFQDIELGKTYDFRLKRVDPQNTVLASVRIRGEENLGMTSGLLKIVKGRIPASQHIFGLKVFPGIDSVRIRFRTHQATPGFLEIKNEDTQATVAVALLAGNLVHDVLIAHGVGFTPEPLDQDTNHSFRIVATALPGSLIPGDKTVTGLFRTGARSAQVFFDRILVHDDGDPGFLLGDGDFFFSFGAGDVETWEDLGNFENYGYVNIGSGEFRDVNRVVTIPRAPVRLWAQMVANEDDSLLGSFGTAARGTSFASPGSSCGGHEGIYGESVMATVTQHFDFSELTDGIEERPLTMSNDSCPIHFTLLGRLRVETHPGVLLQPFINKSGPAPRSPVPRVATLLNAGDRVIVGAGSGIAHAVRLAPGGAAYVTTSSRKPAAPGDRLTRIGGEVAGPLTVVSSSADRVSLFALDRDGAVAHKSLLPDVPPNDEWETLGGAFVGPIAAAVGLDGRIEIFGLASDGGVFHRTLGAAGCGQAARDWQFIGDGVGGSLTAFSSPRGGVSVVASGRKGEVLHKLRCDDEWRPAGREWQSLGAAPAGPLSGELVEDDIVVLAVLSENETIQVLPWRNYPDTPPGDGWQCVGTINSLLDARLSLIEPPFDAGRSGPAAPAGSPQ